MDMLMCCQIMVTFKAFITLAARRYKTSTDRYPRQGKLLQTVLKRREPQRHKDKKSFPGLSELRYAFVSLWFKAFYLLLRFCQKEWPVIPVFDSIFSQGFSALY